MTSSRLLTVLSLDPGKIRRGAKLTAIVQAACDAAGITPKDGDVFCLDSRLVSLAQHGAQAAMTAEEFARATDEHSIRTLAARTYGNPQSTMRLVQTQHGTVELNAGISLDNGSVILPVDDPTQAVTDLHTELQSYYGVHVGVVLTTHLPHPFRVGQRPAALAAAGVDTQRAADLVAAAAALVDADDYRMAVLRGADAGFTDEVTGHSDSLGAFAEWFQLGWAESVHSALGADPSELPPLSGDDNDDVLSRVVRAISAVRAGSARTPGENAWRIRPAGAGTSITIEATDTPPPSESGGHPLMEATLGLGSLVDRLATALWVEKLHARPTFQWADSGVSKGARIDIELREG